MQDISLDGDWQVRHEPLELIGETGLALVRRADAGWLPALVPGEVHLHLVGAGLLGDPSVGLNALQSRWPETRSWWYRQNVDVGGGFRGHERQLLVFEGLDLFAQVFVNGGLVGEAANAFIPHAFDVGSALREGANELCVRLTVGSELAPDDSPPGQGHEPHRPLFGQIPNPAKPGDLYGHRNWFGRKWLRKPQASYGWDWQEALPNIGIWRSVRLEGRSHAVIADLRLDTVRQRGRVSLELDAAIENLHPWAERACALELRVTPPDNGTPIERRYPLAAVPGRTPLRDVIPVPRARLWWPNGMGPQPLYGVTAQLVDSHGTVTDSRTFSIGLRTVTIDRSALTEGTRFCVQVNGQDVFCRGGNTGPHDIIPARITDAKCEELVAAARSAHFTMLRINGVSGFERPAFYDACDRAGILLFHDFPFTCATYPDHDEGLRQAVRVETEAAVAMLRHHPSIAMWSGGNECIWGLCDWYNGDPSMPLDVGGSRLYNQVLPEACRRVDPHRPYWPSSPCGGPTPGSELDGDCHWWGYYFNRDASRRSRHEAFDECRGRFVSEWGFPAPCHADSIREYLAPADMAPGTPAWRTHENQMLGDTLAAGIRAHYGDPEALSLQEYIDYGQMCQAWFHGHAMEALRFRKGDPADDCQGALIWSYSDAWGETGWSLLDYYLRRKAAYYAVRRACAPLKVIVRRRGDHLVTRVVNDTLRPARATVAYGWWRADGHARELRRSVVSVPANGMAEVGTDALPASGDRDPADWFYAAVVTDRRGTALDQSIWTLAPFRNMRMPEAQVTTTRLQGRQLMLCCPVFAHGVHAEDGGRELLSDNWLDLLPGVPQVVRAAPGIDADALRLAAIRPRQR